MYYDAMSDVTQVAFQLDNDGLSKLDELVERHEFRSRAEVLRAAVHEFIARRRESRIDAELAAGYGVQPPGSEDAALAELSVEGLGEADLDW